MRHKFCLVFAVAIGCGIASYVGVYFGFRERYVLYDMWNVIEIRLPIGGQATISDYENPLHYNGYKIIPSNDESYPRYISSGVAMIFIPIANFELYIFREWIDCREDT